MSNPSTPSTSAEKSAPSKPADKPSSKTETAAPVDQSIAPPTLSPALPADLPLAEVVGMLQEQQRLEAEQRHQAQAAALQARQRFD